MNRLIAVLITAFWAIMWTLLIRTEMRPQRTALREVPIEHVMRLFFQHQQLSDLFLHGEGERLGHIRFQPRIREEDNQRVLEFSGNLQLRVPGAARQRVNWDGTAELNPDLGLKNLQMQTSVREASAAKLPETSVSFQVDPATKHASYEVKVDQRSVDHQSFTLDEPGMRSLLDRLGIDPEVIKMATSQVQPGSSAKIAAYKSTYSIKGEQVDTLQVTVEYNGQTMLDCQISQLGQVLYARAITGWTLETE